MSGILLQQKKQLLLAILGHQKTAQLRFGTDCKSEDSSVFEKKTSPGNTKQQFKVTRYW